MDNILSSAAIKANNIKNSLLSIYSEVEIGDKKYWLTSEELEVLLNNKLVGKSVAGLPLRTRSKIMKVMTCEALGYAAPKSFLKKQPRFTGQQFDIYVQKSNNLQVWNEELSAKRRYVLIKLNANDTISKVKVVAGADLANLDKTGTLTQKYQARLIVGESDTELISNEDTDSIKRITNTPANLIPLAGISPIDSPTPETLLPIGEIFSKLIPLIGVSFKDVGLDQERNRGGELHKIVCKALGFENYFDNGQFPDIKQQLLEVKLQTSPTIDLGLVTPDSTDKLDLEKVSNIGIAHNDVRYAIFYADNRSGLVTIRKIYLSTGRDFFTRFPRFGGKVLNKKIQIPLPSDFFELSLFS